MVDLDRYPDLLTSLTIDNLRVRDVGIVLNILRDAGFEIEVNLTRETGPAAPSGDNDGG